MSENTGIEWCDSTFNPWIGCTKVSPGCDHCYAKTMDDRKVFQGVTHWGAGAERMHTSEGNWKLPVKWNANADAFFAKHGRRQRVFCASLADVFDNEVNDGWRVELFELIKNTPNLDWLLLTKRIGNVETLAPRLWIRDGFPKNVWLGISVVNQAEADRDIYKLMKIPATVRFLSMEPLLEAVDINGFIPKPKWWKYHPVECRHGHDYCPICDANPERGIDWVIVGGESGIGARAMHPQWVKGLRDQCASSGIPFLFKQWGEWAPVGRKKINGFSNPHQGYIHHTLPSGQLPRSEDGFGYGDATLEKLGCAYIAKLGKKEAGRLLDGITHDGYPFTTTGAPND